MTYLKNHWFQPLVFISVLILQSSHIHTTVSLSLSWETLIVRGPKTETLRHQLCAIIPSVSSEYDLPHIKSSSLFCWLDEWELSSEGPGVDRSAVALAVLGLLGRPHFVFCYCGWLSRFAEESLFLHLYLVFENLRPAEYYYCWINSVKGWQMMSFHPENVTQWDGMQ